MRDKATYNARSRAAYAAMTPEQKSARLARCRAWNAANPEKRAKLKKYTKEERAAYQREWRKRNPEKEKAIRARGAEAQRELASAHYERTKESKKEQRSASRKRWAKENPAKVAALAAKRRAYKLRATPAWLTPDDLWIINEVYDLCALRSKVTNVQHHVDHVIPLRGRNVCGLHVPLNLRVIPEKDNLTKRNRFSDELLALAA